MKVLLTLDYELFNGLEGGTVQNCIIKPTEKLCEVLDKYNFKATFFVDVCFLLRLQKLRAENIELEKEWDDIIKQLTWLSMRGHDLELHIHPNWYRSSYNNGVWSSVIEDYKLSDIPKDVVSEIFNNGAKLLEEITGKRPVAFRAGAYCLQTLDNYSDTFRKNGIIIDSSVFRNRSAKTDKWEWYDYTSIPEEYHYSFSDDVCKKQENGCHIEVSIPSYRMSAVHYLCYKYKTRKVNSSLLTKWGDGRTSIGGTLLPWSQRILNRIKRTISSHLVPASIDGTSVSYLNYLFKREQKNGDYFLIMGHPKLLTPYSISGLADFLKNNKETIENVTIDSFVND